MKIPDDKQIILRDGCIIRKDHRIAQFESVSISIFDLI